MFLGHYATGFAAKKVVPGTPLPLLLLASQLIDHVWPLFVLVGLERVRIAPGITAFTPLDFTYYPWTHSLLMAAAWGVAFGALVFAFRRQRAEALVLALLVPGHWVLDLVAHRADLPLIPGATRLYGYGLWHSIPATLVVELVAYAAGLALYVSATPAAPRRSRVVVAALAVFLVVIYAVNAFGPPPPNVTAIGVAGNALWLVILWAWWAERGRPGASRR